MLAAPTDPGRLGLRASLRHPSTLPLPPEPRKSPPNVSFSADPRNRARCCVLQAASPPAKVSAAGVFIPESPQAATLLCEAGLFWKSEFASV